MYVDESAIEGKERSVSLPPAGWYPDLVGPHRLRYWDGHQWAPSASGPESPEAQQSQKTQKTQQGPEHVSGPQPSASLATERPIYNGSAPRRWSRLAESAAQQAGLAGAVVYVVVHLSYSAFYDNLGLRPEEVGVDRAQVITQAAVFLISILASAGAVALGGDLFFRWLGRGLATLGRSLHLRAPAPIGASAQATPARDPNPYAVWTLTLVALPTLLAAWMVFVEAPIRDQEVDFIREQLPVGLFLVALTMWLYHRARRKPSIRARQMAILAALFGVYTLFGASYASGRSQAEYLRSHEQLNGTGTAQYAPAAYRADCVTVSRAAQIQPPLHVTTALLLGESGGTIVLWDTNTAAVVRVPESSVIMRSCP
jgi:hypothetical protein